MKYNAAQLALIAAGATPEAILAAATTETLEPVVPPVVAPVVDATAPVVPPVVAPVVDAVAPVAPVVAAVTAPAAPALPDPVVAHLTAQLTASQEAVTAAKIEAAAFKDAAGAVEGLLAIARSSLGNLYVAFNGTAATADTFSATTIVAEHARMAAQFKEKFRVGGVASTPKPQESAPDPVAQAVISYHIPN